MGNGSCGFKFPLEIQVQVALKRHRHIFTVCLERAAKRQDRLLNHIDFEIFISK